MELKTGDVVIPMNPRGSKKFIKVCGIPRASYARLEDFISKKCKIVTLPNDGTVEIENSRGTQLYWIRSCLKKIKRR